MYIDAALITHNPDLLPHKLELLVSLALLLY